MSSGVFPCDDEMCLSWKQSTDPVSFDSCGILDSSWMTGKVLKANLRVGILCSLFIYPALRVYLDTQALTFLAAKLQKLEISIWGEK